MDRCQGNDNKQDIEMAMFLPLDDNDNDKEKERFKNDIVAKDNSSPDNINGEVDTNLENESLRLNEKHETPKKV